MTEKELLDKGYKKYIGEELDIFFNPKVCTHSGICIRSNRYVFDVQRSPWILPDQCSKDELKTIIDNCPSKALQYIEK